MFISVNKDISLKSPFQNSVDSAKTKAGTNMKLMVKIGWKNGGIIDALPKNYGAAKSAVYKGHFILSRDKRC